MSQTKIVEKFVHERFFDVPVDEMFTMWSDPQHLSKWVPPKGFEMTYIRVDIKDGGTAFYRMSGGNGTVVMYGRAHYVKITEPNQLVNEQQFADADEKVIRHPMSATWPETLLTTIDLAEDGPERTKVTITWEPTGNCTEEEMETFDMARDGMTQGWNGSLDKLEDYISERPKTL